MAELASIEITRSVRALAISGILAIFGVASAGAETNEAAAKGFEIAARADRADQGYGDSRVDAEMVLRNSAGQETVRRFSFTTLEKESEDVGDK